jgi:predicted ABC-type ATPase
LPTLIIIAGPNGAGKTTFAVEYALERRKHLELVNADEIARDLERGGTLENRLTRARPE